MIFKQKSFFLTKFNKKLYKAISNSYIKMGRIKTQLIKRVAIKLVKDNPTRFKENFDENKALVTESAEVRSPKLRNVIAGYVTRLVKTKK